MSITYETRRESFGEAMESAKTRQMKIYMCLDMYGAMTSDEIMDKLGYTDPNSVRPRLTELKQMGKVEACGKKLNRLGTLNIALWKVKEKAAPDGANIEDGKG